MTDDILIRINRVTERLDGLNLDDHGRKANQLMRDCADEIERLRANVDRLTSNPADHRYWEGRYRDEATENERLQRIIDSRPAINERLPKSYIEWSGRIYAMELSRARETEQ